MRFRPSKRLLVSCLLAIALLPALARADRPLLYAVRPGDALSLIAERFGISVEELRTWNGIEGDRILVGQELRLAPSGDAAAPSTTTPAADVTPEVTSSRQAAVALHSIVGARPRRSAR